ncbi:MAG: hypothetical protein R6U41_06715, partial [Desulfosalsimonas sp.]|uniref:hypothetical protein n=1 Tax=Desulfosalsimonas sp. TaxID=3073848 RepID=UPI00397092C2
MKAYLWILIFSLMMVPVSGSAAPEDQGQQGPPPLVFRGGRAGDRNHHQRKNQNPQIRFHVLYPFWYG